MKNLLKLILILSFAVSAVFIFAFSSSAKEPTAGYAVWADEESYLKNPDKPLIVSSTAELSTSVGSNKFVLCYGDVTLKGGITVSNGSDLIIDLNGHTLYANSSITVGANASYTPASLTIRNGSIIHESGQFIKAQPNTRVYFEGVTITELASSLFYSDGVRLVYFKDSKLIYDAGAKNGNSINIYPLLDTYHAKIAALEGKNADDFVYEHAVVFDNTEIVDNNFGAAIFNIPQRSDCVPHYSFTFINGSGFNVLDDSFIKCNNTYDGMYVKLNIVKGAAFATPTVPIEDTVDPAVDISYFNKCEIDGVYVTPSEETSLLKEGETQIEGQIPKLIFGASAKESAPYMLCNYLCDVTWVVNGTTTTVTGYADGQTLTNKQESRGYYFKTDSEGKDRVYLDVHSGWSTSPDGEPSERVTLTEREVTLYAIFSEVGPAVAVEFSSSEMKETDIVAAYMSGELGGEVFAGRSDGAYIYLYEDATLDIGDAIDITAGLTIDLGGNTLTRVESLESSTAIFNVQGSSLTVKNGKIGASFIGIANLEDHASLTVTDAEIVFGSYPAFTVSGGTVSIENTSIAGRSDDEDVPVFILARNGGRSEVVAENIEVDVSGALFSHHSTGEHGQINVTLKNSENIKVGSLFGVSPASVNISSTLWTRINLSGCYVYSERVFDIPESSSGYPLMTIDVYLESGSFSSDPRGAVGVDLMLDPGMAVVGTGSGYTVLDSGFTMKYSMSLTESFVQKFYIPASSDFTSVISYLGETMREDLATETIDGEEYYLFEVSGISASDALDTVALKIRFMKDGKEYFSDIEYSPESYFATLITSDDVLEAKLGASALKYIISAYEYSGSIVPGYMRSLLDTAESDGLLRRAREIPERHSDTDEGSLSRVFTGANLYLSSEISVRFNIREDYSGIVKVGATEYSITDGKVGDLTYVSVTLSAVDIYRELIVFSDGEGVIGEYSLTAYIKGLEGTDEALSEMLYSLRAFCYEAHVYSIGGVIPPYIEHTPTVDVEHRVG